jgi:hypothetical protein
MADDANCVAIAALIKSLTSAGKRYSRLRSALLVFLFGTVRFSVFGAWRGMAQISLCCGNAHTRTVRLLVIIRTVYHTHMPSAIVGLAGSGDDLCSNAHGVIVSRLTLLTWPPNHENKKSPACGYSYSLAYTSSIEKKRSMSSPGMRPGAKRLIDCKR